MLVSKRMTIILLIYNIVSIPIEINEDLLGFYDSTGLALAETCLKKLKGLPELQRPRI